MKLCLIRFARWCETERVSQKYSGSVEGACRALLVAGVWNELLTLL